MKNSQTSKSQEIDATFFDIDPKIYGYGEKATLRVQPTPSSDWVEFNAYDFFHWLVDINRLEYFDGNEGRVYSNRCANSVDAFWRDIVISKEVDELLNEYLAAEELGLSTSKAKAA